MLLEVWQSRVRMKIPVRNAEMQVEIIFKSVHYVELRVYFLLVTKSYVE